MALTPQQIQQSNMQFGNMYNSGAFGSPQMAMQQQPAYLQGSQTGSLLQNLQQNPQQGLQSSIPSIGGQNNYIPGQGMPMYAPQQQQAGQFAMLPSGGTTSGISNDLINASRAKANAAQGATSSIPPIHSGTLSTYPGGNAAAGNAAPAGVLSSPAGMPGSSADAWMSPEEMRAKTNAMQGLISPNSGGGGGAGEAALAAGEKDKKGSGSSIPMSTDPQGNSSPQLNASLGQYPSGAPVNFQAPSDMGYAAPGGSQAPGSQAQLGLQMQQTSPQDALAGYMNTPGYQLLMTNQQNQFQQSPGYQYAVNQALGQVQNNASARGLLESGSVMREMTDRAQGMASQGYNDWWNKQNSSFNDYQNRLAGLAGGNVGGDQAFNLGQNLGANTSQAGSDLASLFGNQGAAGYGGMVGTGAAQSGNINNAGTQQAQVQGANASTQLAGAVYNRGLF